MKNRKIKAFTLIELLVVIGAIAILLGLLIPSMNMVLKTANVAKQKVQLSSIDQALLAFKNDYGDYPPSTLDTDTTSTYSYCGAFKLAEALFGWDLFGFHPKSVWKADGMDNGSPQVKVYDFGNTTNPYNATPRKSRYLELEAANAFHIGKASPAYDGLFDNVGTMYPYNYVLCDSFGYKKISVGTKSVTAGMPILYFKADPSKMKFSFGGMPGSNIYEINDNYEIIIAKAIEDGQLNTSNPNPLSWNGGKLFYDSSYKILDQKIWMNGTGKAWPHRPDSYILISAGLDGLYGTSDDITNFGE
jgi:prepilin-type N-terminal cleavage/methylation domain-containing protein